MKLILKCAQKTTRYPYQGSLLLFWYSETIRVTYPMSTPTTAGPIDISGISGNLSDLNKRKFLASFSEDARDPCFGASTISKLRITEISTRSAPEENNRMEGRSVVEVVVGRGMFLLLDLRVSSPLSLELEMLNMMGSIHGGCVPTMIDMKVVGLINRLCFRDILLDVRA